MFEQRRIAEDFGKAAARYASHAGLQEKIGEKLVASATPFIAPGALLLDVGAGSGAVTGRWPCARKVALDMAFGMCREASAQFPAINATAETLPIRDAAVEAVASNLMLQWIPHPERFFAESFRVLKKGGIFAVSTFAEGTLCELQQAFSAAGERGRVSEFLDDGALVRHMERAGFEILAKQCKIMHEPYRDVRELCAQLRAIGAVNKRADRPRGLLTPRVMRRVEAAYPKTQSAIQASWCVLQLVARKI